MHENNFMISVIVPIFDNKNSPQDIFNSINRQTIGFDNLELIFVVDSSVNEFNKVLRDYSDSYNNVKAIFLNKKCNYFGELKNIGIWNSSADYLIFFENVDNLYDTAFELLYKRIECNYDIVFGNWFLSVDGKKTKNTWKKLNFNNEELVIRDIIEHNEIFTFPPAISSKIFKKSIIAENNIEFPENVPCENLVFLCDYLLKSRNVSFVEDCILEYFEEYDLWENAIGSDSKDYLLGLMETCVEISYLFKVDNNLSRKFIHYLNQWFELFIKSELTIFERFEILKFSEFLLSEFKDSVLNSDFKLIIDLVCEKRFYEASVFSNLLNKRLIFRNPNTIHDYQKIVHEIEIFKESLNDHSKIDVETYRFINDLANYNIELRILDKIINIYNDEEIFRAMKLINEWGLFDTEFYISDQRYDLDLDPLLHYVCWGYKEGRNPNENFDGIFYRNYYDNIFKSRLNPLVYFVLHGVDKCEIKIHENMYPESRNSIDKTLLDGKIRNFSDVGVTVVKRNRKLIVSLTSFPERIYELHFTLYSLLNQSLRPDEVILWLAKDQFPNGEEDIPERVLNLKENGLSIEWCDNLFSYKKLIPALKKYPEHIIVTADDDLFYPEDWLKTLYEEHKKYPDLIIAHRIRKISFDNDSISKYNDWELAFHEEAPSFLNFSTNGAGTLFPPNSLHELVFDEDLFSRLCPTSDDVWFWAMATLNNTKIKGVKNNYVKLTYVNLARELYILNQKILFSDNQFENDKHIENVLTEFPIIENIIKDA
ncbi:glycosyltransferase family A protein [Methanobrevibacter sp.]|uniref:glycosyltransferase family A protein n=1 Tax=Methanobrevibacter sp. TaxID=66852 RepID=UPI0025E03C22|nr:glycosyltransferase family A protein [Methanobrevibacter sp.]MBQ6511122.1 glycosyltransferase family 2 protein [Methanobrevibacter sp.]